MIKYICDGLDQWIPGSYHKEATAIIEAECVTSPAMQGTAHLCRGCAGDLMTQILDGMFTGASISWKFTDLREPGSSEILGSEEASRKIR